MTKTVIAVMFVVLGAGVLVGCESGTSAPATPLVLADLAGNWSGNWNNTTYSTTGPVTAQFAFDPGGTSGTATVDPGGNVFGMGDPPALDLPFSGTADSIGGTLTGGPRGDVSFSINSDGTLAATITNVPGGAIGRVEITGTVSATTIDLDYTITFTGGSPPAHGTATLTKS